jgi:serine/threonine protein phosphatase PrpC
VMLMVDARLHVAWVGDSTAVLASEQQQGTVTAQQLTFDHKPDNELVRALSSRLLRCPHPPHGSQKSDCGGYVWVG